MCTLKLGNHPTVKLIDNQIDPEWIKETKELRKYLKEKKLSRVIFYEFDKDVIYKLAANYEEPVTNYTDEAGIFKPLSQRVIGGHAISYDYNFFICRLYGFSEVNLRLAHDLDKDYKLIWYNIDQQHALFFEKLHTIGNESFNIKKFKEAHKKVVTENGVQKDSTIFQEINKWVEKAEKQNVMNWSQVADNQTSNFEFIKKSVAKPFMVECTFGTTSVITNKTQKINDNPFSWGDWQKVRNQLTNNDELYQAVFTEDGKLEYFLSKVKQNSFFYRDKEEAFIKRQYFATNAQPSDKVIYNGEVECAYFKFLLTFLDSDGKIDMKTYGLTSLQSDLTKDGLLYPNLDTVINIWDKLNNYYQSEKEIVKDELDTLRNYFLDYFDSMTMAASKPQGLCAKINRELAKKAMHYADNISSDKKQPLNVKDQRLTKFENSVWFIKNSIILYHKFHEKCSFSLYGMTEAYLKFYKAHFNNGWFSDKAMVDMVKGVSTGTAGRYPTINNHHTKLVNETEKLLKEKKTSTDPGLRRQHNELWESAKDEVLNDVEYNGYYFCPKEGKMLDETNTDLGHDLLKKWGREAKLETTFIQGRKENRKWNKGNFPKPADYLDGVLKTYQHMMSNPQNIEEEVLMKILPCIKVIKKVIEKYEQL